jgi:hypothetical protein
MTLSEYELDASVPQPGLSPETEMSAGDSPDLRDDLTVALLVLEALSEDATLEEEQRRLAQTGLARQLRAVEQLVALVPIASPIRAD